jgi:hypothetical protein
MNDKLEIIWNETIPSSGFWLEGLMKLSICQKYNIALFLIHGVQGRGFLKLQDSNCYKEHKNVEYNASPSL